MCKVDEFCLFAMASVTAQGGNRMLPWVSYMAEISFLHLVVFAFISNPLFQHRWCPRVCVCLACVSSLHGKFAKAMWTGRFSIDCVDTVAWCHSKRTTRLRKQSLLCGADRNCCRTLQDELRFGDVRVVMQLIKVSHVFVVFLRFVFVPHFWGNAIGSR